MHHLILDDLNTVVMLIDPQDRLRYRNAAAGNLFAGMQAEAMLKLPIIYPQGGAQAVTLHELVLRSRDSEQAYSYWQLQLQLPQKLPEVIDCHITPLFEQDNDDILVEINTHRRTAELAEVFEQWQNAHHMARAFAHEINNPLGGIKGAAQLLERALPDEGLREYTQVIVQESCRLQDLVQQMLGPNTPPRKHYLNIHEVLEHVRLLLNGEAPAGTLIQCDYDPSLPLLEADRDQLIQAVLNVVKNAVQAAGDQGIVRLRTRPARNIVIDKRAHKLALQIDIIDNGAGIPPEWQTRIFLPLVSRRAQGSGMGLPIAQALLHAHGGALRCQSRPGETIFTLLLPVQMESMHDDR